MRTRSAEATEKCVRAYAWLLNREEEFAREDTNKNTNNVYGSVFVNEILCVERRIVRRIRIAQSRREIFSCQSKNKAARFERSEKSNLKARRKRKSTCIRGTVSDDVHWLDEKQTQA